METCEATATTTTTASSGAAALPTLALLDAAVLRIALPSDPLLVPGVYPPTVSSALYLNRCGGNDARSRAREDEVEGRSLVGRVQSVMRSIYASRG